MGNVIAIAVLVLILAAAVGYVYKAKKSGAKCVGCPHAKSCGAGKCTCASQEK